MRLPPAMPQRPQPNSTRIARGADSARTAGLEVHAGHGLDFVTAERIAALAEIAELNIGHFLIGEAIFVGLDEAVRTMRAAMDRGRHQAGARPMIIGIGSDLIDIRRIAKVIERHGDRFLDRIFTDDRARQGRHAGATGSKPTPSVSPPRRPAPRRWAPGSAPASGGAIWAWSTCRAAVRPWN